VDGDDRVGRGQVAFVHFTGDETDEAVVHGRLLKRRKPHRTRCG
jgi:hypothetical protein